MLVEVKSFTIPIQIPVNYLIRTHIFFSKMNMKLSERTKLFVLTEDMRSDSQSALSKKIQR